LYHILLVFFKAGKLKALPVVKKREMDKRLCREWKMIGGNGCGKTVISVS
jgi:hypothetical protein